MFAAKCAFVLVVAVATTSVSCEKYLTELAKGRKGAFEKLELLSHYGTSNSDCKVELDSSEINCKPGYNLIATKILVEDATQGGQIKIHVPLDSVEIFRQPEISGYCPSTAIIWIYVACEGIL